MESIIAKDKNYITDCVFSQLRDVSMGVKGSYCTLLHANRCRAKDGYECKLYCKNDGNYLLRDEKDKILSFMRIYRSLAYLIDENEKDKKYKKHIEKIAARLAASL